MNFKKNGKVFTSNFFGTGPSSYKKRIYRAAVSQRLRNTSLVASNKIGQLILPRIKVTVFWDITKCNVLNNNISTVHTASMFRVRELLPTEKKGTLSLEVLVFEYDGLLSEGINAIKNKTVNVRIT